MKKQLPVLLFAVLLAAPLFAQQFTVRATSPAEILAAGGEYFTMPADDFVSGGLRLDAPDEFLRFPQMGRVSMAQGTAELIYQPLYNSTDSVKSILFATCAWKTVGCIAVHRYFDNSFLIVTWKGPIVAGQKLPIMEQETVVAPAYSALDVLKLRVSWDWTVPVGTKNVRVWFNGTELSLRAGTSGPPPFTIPAESPSEYIWLSGRELPAPSWNVGNIVNEFRTWQGVVPPVVTCAVQ